MLSTEQKEDQVAFRQGQNYIARLVRKSGLEQQSLTLRQHGSYLITGGLRGLGLEGSLLTGWYKKELNILSC